MLTLERQMEIMKLLEQHRSVKISDLAKKFYLSEATIRRDLDKMEEKGYLKRTYGGAVLLQGLSSEISFDVRTQQHELEKDIIARLAAQHVHNSDIIIMDSSTTVLAMVQYLANMDNLTIITNGIRTINALNESAHHNIYCAGGKISKSTHSLSGQQTENFLTHYVTEKLFFSCRAVSPNDGAMDFSDEDARVKQVMISRAEEVFLLCDSSKIENKAFCKVCSFDAIDYFVTDQEPTGALLDALNKAEVIIIHPKSQGL